MCFAREVEGRYTIVQHQKRIMGNMYRLGLEERQIRLIRSGYCYFEVKYFKYVRDGINLKLSLVNT